jgi:TPR repeat protein
MANARLFQQAPVLRVSKQLTIKPSEYDPLLARFRIVKFLLHPTIIPPLDLFRGESTANGITVTILTPCIEPGGLNNLIKRHPTWAPINILYGVAIGLRVLHAAGCPHGSVSLGNVVLNGDDLEPSLIDCGLWPTCDLKVKEYSDYVEANGSRMDRLFGLAPEEFKGNCPATVETDVYEFGSLFYMLLKESVPFPTKGAPVRAVKKDFDFRARPSVDGLPQAAVDILNGCWKEDPGERLAIDDVIDIIEANPTRLGFSDVSVEEFVAYSQKVKVAAPELKASFLTSLAAGGSASAAFFLGQLFEVGDGVPQNTEQALEWFQRADDGHCPFGSFQAGKLVRNSDPALAAQYFRRGAASGHPDSLNALGELTESGYLEGGATRAARLYGQGVILGSDQARANYRRCITDGNGIEANEELAARFRYQENPSVEDPAAIALANARAALARGLTHAAEGADRRAKIELRAAADAGNVDALYALGWLAENGRISGDADALYRDAAEKGSASAQNNLGMRLIRSGRKEEGYELISRAAWAGDPSAMNNIAAAIESGEYTGDIRCIAGLYRDAAGGGVTPAYERYASVVRDGIGITRNPAEAQRFLGKAEQQRSAS